MRKNMIKSDFFGGLLLSSRVLKCTFANILMKCQAVSFSLNAWLLGLGFVAFGHYPGDT